MLEKISSVSKLEAEGELKLMQLSTLRLDASNLEAVKQLKGKSAATSTPQISFSNFFHSLFLIDYVFFNHIARMTQNFCSDLLM